MSRRRLLLFGVSVAVVMLDLGGFVLWAQPRTAITRENAAKLQRGMTLEEVQASLGGPARNDGTGLIEEDDPNLPPLPISWPENGTLVTWVSSSVKVDICFATDDRMVESYVDSIHRVQQSPLDMLRRWLGL